MRAVLRLIVVGILCHSCDEAKEGVFLTINNPTFSLSNIQVYESSPIDLDKKSLIKELDSTHSSITIQLNIAKPQFATFSVADSLYIGLYLENGYDLEIDGFSDFPLLEYSGKGSDINASIYKIGRLFKDNEKPFFWTLDLNDFRERVQLLENETEGISNGLNNQSIKEIARNYTDTRLLAHKFNYLMVNSDLNKELINGEFNESNEANYDFLLTMKEDVEGNTLAQKLKNPSYPLAIAGYTQNFILADLNKGFDWTTDTSASRYVKMSHELIMSSELSQESRQMAAASNMYNAIIGLGTDVIGVDWIATLEEDFGPYYGPIRSEIENARRLLPGQPVPELILSDHEGNPYKLEDLKGKVIYVDLWATWCGPCIKKMPKMWDLVSLYEGQPIEFLFLSIDNKKENWLKFLDKESIPNKDLFVWSDDYEQVYSKLSMAGIPRYLLIDENGDFIDAYAPDPDEITMMLDAALVGME